MVSLNRIDRSKIKSIPREVHLERIKRFMDAQANYERVCRELGIKPFKWSAKFLGCSLPLPDMPENLVWSLACSA